MSETTASYQPVAAAPAAPARAQASPAPAQAPPSSVEPTHTPRAVAGEEPVTTPRPAEAGNDTANKREPVGATDQGGSAADRNITALIRKSVVVDKDLSLRAKNITIVTKGGKVTLVGTVQNANEKRLIAAKAMDIQGVTDVDDRLEIKK